MSLERMHELLFEMSSDGIVLHDFSATGAPGCFIAANAAICKLLGYRAEEMRRLSPLDLLARGGPVPDLAGEAEAMQRGAALLHEKVLVSKDGRSIPVEISSRMFEDQGRTLAMSVIRDIAGRRRAEEALRAQLALKDQLAKMAASVPGAVNSFRLRPDGSASMPFSTPAIEELYGISQAVLAQDMAPCFANIHRDDLARVNSGIAESARAMSSWHGEFRYLHPVKGQLWIEGWSGPTREPDGSILWHGYVTDVTERRRAELALSESESLYRSLFTLTPSGVVLLDEAGNLEAFNDQAYRQLGYTREEFARLNVGDIDMAEREPAELLRHLGAIARSGSDEFEAPHRTKSGEIRNVVVNSRPVEVGGRKHFIAVWQDVTERKRAAAAMAQREHRLRTILLTALDGFYAVDLEARILEVNDAYCEMAGYSRAELLQMRISELEAVEAPEEVASRLERIRRLGGDRFETRHRRKDGRVIDVEASVKLVAEEGDTIVCFVRDVTERKRAADTLRLSEARFRALIENSTDIVLVLDEDGCLRLWSPSATQALGWTSGEVLGRSVFELVHPDERERVAKEYPALLSAGSSTVRASVRAMRKDGAWREVEVVARNLLHDPSVRGVLVNGRDVTEQRRVGEQLQQSQKLESVGRLAGGIAHDFNNLLTVINSCAETLKEEVGSGSPAQREMIDDIHGAGVRAAELTRQLLAFARKQVIAPVPLDLNTVVRGSEKLLGRVLGEDVELVTSLEPALWTVRCDRGQVEQVLLNLGINARDAMPRGGKLTIETANAQVDEEEAALRPPMRSGPHVRVTVRDTGVGMTDEVKAHVFEPFFTTKPRGKGTGLGLATIHGIVHQSEGFILLESEGGRGTRFELYFPRISERTAQAVGAVTTARHGTETILLVEDDAQVREVTHRSLRAGGYRVIVARNGREALELSSREEGPVHLLVTDVVMPGLNGREVAEALRRSRPDLRVLFVSGYPHDVISDVGALGSGTHFLPKPFTAAVFLERVRKVLDPG